MTQISSENITHCLEARDPALPGDPWSRLRYQYGQLLGAEDFEQEQTHFVLRRRLHNALLHGFGTAWGLRVHTHDNRSKSQLLINHGLGFDVLGRAIYVNENEQTPCLDVSGLHTTDFWKILQCANEEESEDSPCPPVGEVDENCDEPESTDEQASDDIEPVIEQGCDDKPEDDEPTEEADDECDVKIAYVVISYRAGLSHKVPAITSSCDMSADEALVFSRITDQYFAEIVANPPEYEADLIKQWLDEKEDTDNSNLCWHTLRDRLVDYILNGKNLSLEKFWNKNTKAPLLLAKVELTHSGDQTSVTHIDNNVRPLLPSVQIVGEQLLGQKLNAADKRQPLKLLAIKQLEDADYKFELSFSRPLAEQTFNEDTVKLYRLKNNDWVGPLEIKIEVDCTIARIEIEGCINSDCAMLQFYLAGSNQKPIVSKAGMPLDGWWDEPVSGMGRGRDISFIRNWEKLSTGGESHEIRDIQQGNVVK